MDIRETILIIVVVSILSLTIMNIYVNMYEDESFYSSVADFEVLNNQLTNRIKSISENRIAFVNGDEIIISSDGLRIHREQGPNFSLNDFEIIDFNQIDVISYVEDNGQVTEVAPEKPLFELYLEGFNCREVYTLCAE